MSAKRQSRESVSAASRRASFKRVIEREHSPPLQKTGVETRAAVAIDSEWVPKRRKQTATVRRSNTRRADRPLAKERPLIARRIPFTRVFRKNGRNLAATRPRLDAVKCPRSVPYELAIRSGVAGRPQAAARADTRLCQINSRRTAPAASWGCYRGRHGWALAGPVLKIRPNCDLG